MEQNKKLAKQIELYSNGRREFVGLTEDDLVFITNGGCVENSSIGS